MINKKTIPDLELSLCSKCASVYYNDKKYHIERADQTQIVYEECMMCKNPHGFDFNIWVKPTLRCENSHHCGGGRK